MVGGQLVAEWRASGTHVASFLGVGGNGRAYSPGGVTIVTRRDGKFVRESHCYDAAGFRRQVEGEV